MRNGRQMIAGFTERLGLIVEELGVVCCCCEELGVV